MIKRIIISLILCVAALTPSQLLAQTATRWGVTVGGNYNNIYFKQKKLMEVTGAFGPVGGVMGELNFAGAGFGVDAGLLYSMRCGKINYQAHQVWSSLGLDNEMCRMHYLDVPLHLKFKYHKLDGVENTIMPLIYAGPTFSFLLGKNLDGANQYKTLSVLIQVGIGAELFRHWQLQVGYGFGVGEALRTRLLDENTAKNRCWNATLTYYFK
ncbi:MAG: PorT family protein [Muribaculaceae bacterium]|nr:PorT family protein [Muribaculaceae bacterium]